MKVYIIKHYANTVQKQVGKTLPYFQNNKPQYLPRIKIEKKYCQLKNVRFDPIVYINAKRNVHNEIKFTV